MPGSVADPGAGTGAAGPETYRRCGGREASALADAGVRRRGAVGSTVRFWTGFTRTRSDGPVTGGLGRESGRGGRRRGRSVACGSGNGARSAAVPDRGSRILGGFPASDPRTGPNP